MAKKDAAPKPDKEAVQQVVAEVENRLKAQQTADTVAPEGAQAGLFKDGGAGLFKLLPQLVTPLLKIAGMGVDGQLSAAEVQEIAGDVFEIVTRILARKNAGPAA